MLAPTERKLATLIACVAFPLVCLYGATLGQALGARRGGWHYAVDFHVIWRAGRAFAHGQSPYPSFPYPVPAAAAFAPFGLLPYPVAAALFSVVSIAAVVATLWVLEVRDWRCYGIAFTWPAVTTAVSIGTLTPLLALALALMWRYRDSAVRCALALVVAVGAKLFLWPLVVWLVVSGRRKTAALAGAIGAALTVVAWGAIGFRDIGEYASVMHKLAAVESARGYGVSALVGSGPALWALTLAAVGGCAVAARRGAGERTTFTCLTLIGLAFSPIVWLHYFALLVPLVALWSRRFALAWVIPVALWLTPWQKTDDLWRILLAEAVALAAVGLAAKGTVQRSERFRGLSAHDVQPAFPLNARSTI